MLRICSWCDHIVNDANQPERKAQAGENANATHGCCDPCKALLDAGQHPVQQLHRECSGLMNDALGG